MRNWQAGVTGKLRFPESKVGQPASAVPYFARMSDGHDTLHGSPGPALFVTTHWSVVLAAGLDESAVAGHALEQLCRTYWYPL